MASPSGDSLHHRIPFDEFGPSSRYWLDAFNLEAPLHRFLSIGPVSDIPFPQERFDLWSKASGKRKAIVEAIAASNLPLSPVQAKALERLSEPKAMVVVTGQQPGALGGPLYTYSKILSAIVFSGELQEQWNIPVIPILWDGGDDHDLAEVDELAWPAGEGGIARYRFGLSQQDGRSAWSVPVTKEMLEGCLAFISEVHPPTDYRRQTTDFICSLWEGGASWCDLFDNLWLRIYADSPLLVARPWEKLFRVAAEPVLRKEIENPMAASLDLETVSLQLESTGYKPYIHKKKGACSFFWIQGDERKSVTFEDERFHIEGGKSFSRAEMAEMFDREPGNLSPNALLRPVVQDSILPTAATVLGPSEIAYHAQMGGFYKRHNLPRPWILPRLSITLAAESQAERLAQMGLTWKDLKRDEKDLCKRLATSPILDEVLGVIKTLAIQVGASKESLDSLVKSERPGLSEPLESQFGRMEKILGQVEDLFRRAEGKRDATTLARLKSLKAHLLPEGELQERVYGLVPFLCRHGFGWLPDILEDAGTWDGESHVVYVIGSKEKDV